MADSFTAAHNIIKAEIGQPGHGPKLHQALDEIDALLEALKLLPRTGIITFDQEFDNGNSGAAKTIDFNNGQKQKCTLTDNCVITVTAPSAGVGNFQVRFIQGTIGGHIPSFPTNWTWSNNSDPEWPTAAGAVSIVSGYFDGTDYWAAHTGFA